MEFEAKNVSNSCVHVTSLLYMVILIYVYSSVVGTLDHHLNYCNGSVLLSLHTKNDSKW